MKKKGVSGVIVAVLMILIVIAAVVILWVVISGFIESNTEGVEAGLSTLSVKLVENSLQYDADSNQIGVLIERKEGKGNLSKIKFILEGEDGQTTTQIVPIDGGEMGVGAKRRVKFNDIDGKIVSITAYPVATIGGKDKVGVLEDTIGVGSMATSDGLVLHLPFDDEIGDGVASDSVGINDGVCAVGTTCPGLVTGKFGGAYDFDGNFLDAGEGDFIFVDSPDFSLDGTKESVFMWANFDNIGDYRNNKLFCEGGVDAPASSKKRFIASATAISIDFNPGAITGSTALENGNWYFIGYVFNEGNTKLYVDGVKKEEVDGLSLSQSGNWYIGHLCHGGAPSCNKFFDGQIDEVRIYDRALTPEEVANLYRFN